MILGVVLAAALGAQGPDLPRDVRAFIARRQECDHWTGEEPYDKARAREIDSAIRDLRCARIDRDERRLMDRYPKSPAVLRALRIARDGV